MIAQHVSSIAKAPFRGFFDIKKPDPHAQADAAVLSFG